MVSTLESIEDLLSTEAHCFLYRNMEMPAYDEISPSCLGLGIRSVDLVKLLKMTMSNGFLMDMYIPNKQATAKAKAKTADTNIAEDGRASPLQQVQARHQHCYNC